MRTPRKQRRGVAASRRPQRIRARHNHSTFVFEPLWPDVRDAIARTSNGNARILSRSCPPGHWIDGLNSPLREDRHPSFSVCPDSETNPGGFKDHATGEHGSMADLGRRLGIDPPRRR